MARFPPFPLEVLNGGLTWVILIGKQPGYPYDKDGKRSSEIPDRFRYSVVLPGCCFTPLSVDIPSGIDALSDVSDEQIAQGCASLRPILVQLTECFVKIYTIKGEQKMTATASSIELVKTGK